MLAKSFLHPNYFYFNPVLRMLEIKSEKYKDLSYVLAAEDYRTIHLLIVRTGENQSIQLKESKNVSSSRRILT